MTTIDQIKAECHRAIELGEKSTGGPWESKSDGRITVSGDIILETVGARTTWHEDDANCDHIAHSRTFSPSAARALLIAITALETCQVWDDKNSRMIYPAGCALGLEKIIAAWEGGK